MSKPSKGHSSKKKGSSDNKSQHTIGSSLGFFISSDNIHQHYNLQEVIGSGYFGNVRKATNKDQKISQHYAIKCILKSKVADKLQLLQRELMYLMTVDHPNIIKLYEVFEDSNYIYLVMELCSGGELFEKIIEKQKFSEAEAAEIMFCIMHAICHLHSEGISHRDLKPENILYNQEGILKIIDFGLAKKFWSSTESLHTIVGTPYYVAPEVLEERYGLECDLWSAGVIMFMLLSGSPPFEDESDNKIFMKIMECNYSMEGPVWDQISKEAKDLIGRMLCRDVNKRITGQQALGHPWFRNAQSNPVSGAKEILNRISFYEAGNKLKRYAMKVMVRQLKGEEINSLTHLFRELDTDRTGYITAKELKIGLKKVGISLRGTQVRGIVEKADLAGNGKINYSEFLQAALDQKYLSDVECLWTAFRFFDVDESGQITIENLKEALSKIDSTMSPEEFTNLIREANFQDNDKLDFNEFCRMLGQKV